MIVDDEGMVHFSSEEPSEAEMQAYNRERAERIVEKVIDDLDDILTEISTAKEHEPSEYFDSAKAGIYVAMAMLENWQSGIPNTK